MFRFAFDLGTNSIGWCVLLLGENLQPQGIRDMGVRIFSDGRNPKDGASLAVARRLARQARRRRDRFLGRKNALMDALVRHGLMPADTAVRKELEQFDPYRLRAEGLEKKLPLPALARALWHLNQRRGFKSNRKTDAADEKGVVASGIARLHELLDQAGTRTLGEYLYSCKQRGNPTRVRSEGSGARLSYPFYPDRSLLEQEFDALWQAQQAFHPVLTDGMADELRQIIFYQRPLEPVEVGRCTLEPTERRAPVALPSAQKARILQSLNHLRILSPELRERPLSIVERKVLLEPLLQGKKLTFNQIRKALKLEAGFTFNLENAEESGLTGDASARVLSDKKRFGPAWHALDAEQKTQIILLLLAEEDTDVLCAELMRDWGVSREQAEAIASAPLPAGYAAHCSKVLDKLCDVLEEEVISYAEARQKIGYPYKEPTGEILPNLPYYGCVLERYVGKTGNAGDPLEQRFGRISNPTVHIALNQLRRVVNELIKLYGLPAQIVLEVGRDLKNGLKAKEEIRKRQNEFRKENDRRRALLLEHGIAVTGDGMLRLRLWEELNPHDAAARCCVYTGEPISFARLFGDDIEIEHILPFSRTLDNSPANKTVALRRANRDKGNNSPYEAFGDAAGYCWADILDRSSALPKNKQWRFAADAMERFDADEAFLSRQLTDTQYISRVAREYLCAVCPPNQVWVTPGQLTANLAAAWKFPPKNRDDHTHHARDAALIGVTDRRLLQQAARHHASHGAEAIHRLLNGFPEPWPHFRDQVLGGTFALTVSHKADHGINAALHDDTAYGVLAPNGQPRNAQHRKPVSGFSAVGHLLDIKEIKLQAEMLRDISGKLLPECLEFLRSIAESAPSKAKKALQDFLGISDKMFAEAFAQAAARRGIRRIRIVESKTLVPIRNKEDVVYKGLCTSGNAWYDVFEDPSGKWRHRVVSFFAAANPSLLPEAPEGRHVLRLFKNDMVELEEDGKKNCYYVMKFDIGGQIYLVSHQEANPDKRNRDKENPFVLKARSASTLQQQKAKAVYVSPAGRIIYRERPCRVAERCGNKRK